MMSITIEAMTARRNIMVEHPKSMQQLVKANRVHASKLKITVQVTSDL